MADETDLSTFAAPPIQETYCSVTFAPLKLPITLYGPLHDLFRTGYPKFEEHPPIVDRAEEYQVPPAPVPEEYEVQTTPRVWFVSEVEDRLIQIQRDRFIHNWRERIPNSYPRFSDVFGEFQRGFNLLAEFSAQHNLGDVTPTQFELSYINHVKRWCESPKNEEMGRVFPDLSWRATLRRQMGDLEAFHWKGTFRFPNNSGRLRVGIRSAFIASSLEPLILFELRAKGIGDDRSPQGMIDWFNMAHVGIVRTFEEMTSADLQSQEWGKQ